MRVQVDVYRGPLALDPEIQWNRLLGQLGEANTALDFYIKGLMEDVRVRSGMNFPTKGAYKNTTTTTVTEKPPGKITTTITISRPDSLPDPSTKAEIDGNNKIQTTIENKNSSTKPLWACFKRNDEFTGTYNAFEPMKTDLETHLKSKTGAKKTFLRKAGTVDNLRRLKLLMDACDTWEMVNNTQAAALLWTRKYDTYRGAVKAILANDGEYDRVETQIQKLVSGEADKGTRRALDNVREALNKDQNKKLKKDLTKVEQLGKTLRKAASKRSRTLTESLDNRVKLREALQGLLAEFVQIGTRLKNKAGYWSWIQTIEPSIDKEMRQYMFGFSIIAAEYSNRIVSASDALLKQTYLADRREMPISSLIRDAKPTHVTSLLVFNKVAGHTGLFDGKEVSYDRLRAMEQLYGDDSWANINQAYASGRGDTAMAFIKDDVGNWNLKNFDQDPSKVVKAYKDLGLAAIKTATDLASGGTASKVSQAQKMFLLGNKLTMGGTGLAEPTENPQIKALHNSAITTLTTLRKRVSIQATAYQTIINENVDATDEKGVAKKEAAEKELATLLIKAAGEVEGILETHNQIITAMEAGIVNEDKITP